MHPRSDSPSRSHLETAPPFFAASGMRRLGQPESRSRFASPRPGRLRGIRMIRVPAARGSRNHGPDVTRARTIRIVRGWAPTRWKATVSPVCVPGSCNRRRRRAGLFSCLWPPRRCRTADRSRYPRSRSIRAWRASLPTEGHRQFTRSKGRYRLTHPPEPACHWRCGRTVAGLAGARPAAARRTSAACRCRG